VKPGHWVGILGDVATLPALRAVYHEVLNMAAIRLFLISDEWMARTFLREANDDQIAWLDPTQGLFTYEKAILYRIGSSNNTRAMTNIDAKRTKKCGGS